MSEQNKEIASTASTNHGIGFETAQQSPTNETPNSSTERARRVFEAHLAVLKNPQSTSNYGEFLTDDAVYEFPFAPGEFPTRIEGKEKIIKHMNGLPQIAKSWQFRDVTFSATTNPDVFFVEFIVSAEATATRRKYEQPVIARAEMRGEKMAKYREFLHSQAIVDAFMP